MRAKQEDVVKERERHIAIAKGEAHLKNAMDSSNKLRQTANKQRSALSFDLNEDEEDDDDDEVSNHSTESDRKTDGNEIHGTKHAPGLDFVFHLLVLRYSDWGGTWRPKQHLNRVACKTD